MKSGKGFGMADAKFTYQDYVTDAQFLDAYNEYQRKYAGQVRESDKRLIELVLKQAERVSGTPKVLDIGCSTGNFLLHLHRIGGARLDLVGGDLAETSLEIARANPELAAVRFERMNILELEASAYDIIVVNCVLYMMDDAQYLTSLAAIARALRPGGVMIAYDFAHPFPQEVEITETTDSHPQGLRICFRSFAKIKASTAEAGFPSVDIMPFELPIDLPRIDHEKDIITYTRRDEFGERMMFRGTLFQPWAHMVAHR